jgi:hypothetical protein
MPRVVSPNDRRLKANRQNPDVRTSILLSQARNAQQSNDSEDYSDEDTRESGATATISHLHFGRIPVYKLTPSGCVRIEVNVQSLADVLKQDHYSDVCFDCGSPNCLYQTNIKGETSTNQCPGKAPKKFRVCPEVTCRKRIYDTVSTGARLEDEFDHSSRGDAEEDENAIRDGMYDSSTPETRTRSLMENHIIGFHLDLARELGLGKAPELPRLAVV